VGRLFARTLVSDASEAAWATGDPGHFIMNSSYDAVLDYAG
jgi:hypothetical protein